MIAEVLELVVAVSESAALSFGARAGGSRRSAKILGQDIQGPVFTAVDRLTKREPGLIGDLPRLKAIIAARAKWACLEHLPPRQRRCRARSAAVRALIRTEYGKDLSPEDLSPNSRITATASPLHELVRREEIARLDSALDALPQSLRRFVPSLTREQTDAQTAAEFGISRKTVSRRKNKLRAELARLLSDADA